MKNCPRRPVHSACLEYCILQHCKIFRKGFIILVILMFSLFPHVVTAGKMDSICTKKVIRYILYVMLFKPFQKRFKASTCYNIRNQQNFLYQICTFIHYILWYIFTALICCMYANTEPAHMLILQEGCISQKSFQKNSGNLEISPETFWGFREISSWQIHFYGCTFVLTTLLS